MRFAIAFLFTVMGCAGPATTPATTPAASLSVRDPGMVVVASHRSMAETTAALEAALNEKGLRLFARIDHAANAAGVGIEIPATVVFVFGNPKVGTLLMQESRTTAMDLPQRMLVWQTGDDVNIAYNDPAWLGQRHGLTASKPILDKIAGLLGALAAAAAGS